MNRITLAILMGAAFTGLQQSVQEGSDGGGSKAPKFAEKDFDLDTGEVIFSFGNGTELKLDVNSLSPEIQKRLMFHGTLQKIGDSYAGAKGDFSKAIESARSVIEQLQSGEWRAARGEGEGRPRLGELSEAIARVKGVSVEEATTAVTAAAALDGDEAARAAGAEKLKAWRAHPKIKAAIAAIRAEKAQAEADAAGGDDEISLD